MFPLIDLRAQPIHHADGTTVWQRRLTVDLRAVTALGLYWHNTTPVTSIAWDGNWWDVDADFDDLKRDWARAKGL